MLLDCVRGTWFKLHYIYSAVSGRLTSCSIRFMARDNAGSSNRSLSRTPSPEPRLRPKREEQAPSATRGPQEDGAYVSEHQFLAKLKPLKGLVADDLDTVMVGQESYCVYGLEGQKNADISRLWCLHTDTMEWEHISVRFHVFHEHI